MHHTRGHSHVLNLLIQSPMCTILGVIHMSLTSLIQSPMCTILWVIHMSLTSLIQSPTWTILDSHVLNFPYPVSHVHHTRGQYISLTPLIQSPTCTILVIHISLTSLIQSPTCTILGVTVHILNLPYPVSHVHHTSRGHSHVLNTYRTEVINRNIQRRRECAT